MKIIIAAHFDRATRAPTSMWFRNYRLYRLSKSLETDAAGLAERLAAHPFMPCSGQQWQTAGFVPPLDSLGTDLVHASSGCILVCLKRQEKIIPAAVVRETLEERLREIESKEGHKPGRRQKSELKEQIVLEMLPRAFARSQKVFAYIDTRRQLLACNTTSTKRCEELLSALRDALGSLPVQPLVTRMAPVQAMTHWLGQRATPHAFSLGEECLLADLANPGSAIHFRQQDLQAAEIRAYLDGGMVSTRLGLGWNETMQFVLDDQACLRKIALTDVVKEQLAQENQEDAAALFDAEFTLMTQTLGNMLDQLLPALGGVAEPA